MKPNLEKNPCIKLTDTITSNAQDTRLASGNWRVFPLEFGASGICPWLSIESMSCSLWPVRNWGSATWNSRSCWAHCSCPEHAFLGPAAFRSALVGTPLGTKFYFSSPTLGIAPYKAAWFDP